MPHYPDCSVFEKDHESGLFYCVECGISEKAFIILQEELDQEIGESK